jgi:CBS-domain-containing membrane protein
MISFLFLFIFPLGSPFGALVTLLYGLTSAPASQPRSAIAGQTVAMTISLVISYADNISIWMRQALATSLAVAAMAKLGVMHPPAGAAALVFASGSFGWGNMLFVLVGNVIAIGAATFINNFSEYRQYPIFWGLHCSTQSISSEDMTEAKLTRKKS